MGWVERWEIILSVQITEGSGVVSAVRNQVISWSDQLLGCIINSVKCRNEFFILEGDNNKDGESPDCVVPCRYSVQRTQYLCLSVLNTWNAVKNELTKVSKLLRLEEIKNFPPKSWAPNRAKIDMNSKRRSRRLIIEDMLPIRELTSRDIDLQYLRNIYSKNVIFLF